MRAQIFIVATAALALSAATAAPDPAEGQTSDYGELDRGLVEASGGISLPFGDLGDVQDPGPAVEVGGSYRVHERVAVRVDGSMEFLRGADAPDGGQAMPDMRVLRIHGGLDVVVVSPGTRLTVLAGAGAGAAVYDTDRFAEPVFNPATDEPEADFNQIYFTSAARVKVAYTVQPRVGVFASAGGRLSFADAQETALFAAFDPGLAGDDPDGEVEGSELLWTVPLSVGAEVRF